MWLRLTERIEVVSLEVRKPTKANFPIKYIVFLFSYFLYYSFLVLLQLSIQCRESHFCGATLLNAWTAITAAHCCDKITTGRCKVSEIKVIGGDHSLSRDDGMEQTRTLMDYIQHSKFRVPKFFNDICLLHLDNPFIFNRYVQPINVVTKTPYYGEMCSISGWGSSTEGSFQPEDILMFAQVPILQEVDCELPYGLAEYDRKQMICAGYSQVSHQSWTTYTVSEIHIKSLIQCC